MNTPESMTDVAIIGGGPAGATAAALLAPHVRVVVLERERFPRFHIGESLLPAALPVFAELGFDAAQAGHQFKAGARFHDEVTGRREEYMFADGLGGFPDHAFQVERSIFDAQLLAIARERGAEVRHGVTIRAVEFLPGGVRVHSEGESIRARYLVDASGHRALLARQLRALVPLRDFGRAAVFGHHDNLGDDALAFIGSQGNVEVLRVEEGWAWAIPLQGRRLSVGVVTTQGPIEPSLLARTIERSPLLRRLTAGTSSTSPTLVGDYSYRNERSFGAHYCCVGDAACFLDPVFSSGVSLALQHARAMVEVLQPALADGREGEPDLMMSTMATMSAAYRCFSALIYRFYHSAMLDNLFLGTDPDPRMRAGLISMLAGDVWRDDNPFQELVLASVRRPVPDAR